MTKRYGYRDRPFGVHKVKDLVYGPHVQTIDKRGMWVRAVPIPYSGNKLIACWWIIRGKAHALIWPEPGDLEAALNVPVSEKDSLVKRPEV